VRALAGLPQVSWTDAPLVGVQIKAVHVEELRTAITPALQALSLTVPGFTDAQLFGVIIKKLHIEEVRAGVNSSGAGDSGGGSSPIPVDGLASASYDSATNRNSGTGWEYDATGNQTRVQRADGLWQRYVYDAAGRLVKVQNDSGVTQVINTYGASNHRLIEQVGNESSNQRAYYAWAGDSVIAEYEETAAAPTTPRWVKSYVYLGARLLATIAPNGASERVEYQHPDRLGTRLVTNSQDTTSFEQAALPFGTALDAESSGATKRRFTSYDRSTVTGLDYAVNRHYDPLQGRFTQVDPIGMSSVSLASPQTLNLYAYCANDPINHTDPSGLGFFSFIGKIFGFIGKVLHFVAKVLAVASAVLSVVFLALGNPGFAAAFAIISGLLFAAVYGPPIVGKLLTAVGGAVRANASVVPGTPPINPNASAGVGPITSFLSNSQVGLANINWLSLLLKVSVNFSWARSQRAPQGELRECGIFTARITIRTAGWGHIPGGLASLIVASIQPGKNHYQNGFRQIGQGSYQLNGDRLVYTGTYQVGNILSGGVTANPGIRVNIGVAGGGAGDVIRLGVIDVAKSQEGAQGSYLEMRDTMPGADSKDPFAKCP
jgi:RHS repeat-associated protein